MKSLNSLRTSSVNFSGAKTSAILFFNSINKNKMQIKSNDDCVEACGVFGENNDSKCDLNGERMNGKRMSESYAK